MDRTARLTLLCQTLVDQHAARVIVEPQQRASGFWFGGGNLVRHPDGRLYLVGRYRHAGDSRRGVAEGTRGAELAIFSSDDDGRTFQKLVSWDKAALRSPLGEVLSIEGSCLRLTRDGVQLFVSTEKLGIPYPAPVTSFLKPGAGVWTIDVLRADTVAGLRHAPVHAFLHSADPRHLHVKDPFVWPTAHGDRLGYCSHPFNWTSSNTGVVDLADSGGSPTAAQRQHGVFPRGTTWDVAMARGTCVLPLPAVGEFRELQASLLFYCGGECVRPLEEHAAAVRRPRGYSCEELGGAAWLTHDDVTGAQRLSDLFPLFVSPWGTGCSRYTKVLDTPEGFYVTWQQSQPDLSQPLVLNFVPRARVLALLQD